MQRSQSSPSLLTSQKETETIEQLFEQATTAYREEKYMGYNGSSHLSEN